MNEYGIWKTIKTGFWFGLGLIIPLIVVMYGGRMITVFAMSSVKPAITSQIDAKKHIEIISYEDKTKDGQLLILGSLKNNGSASTSSIQLEAELFDNNDKFVYECTEYVSNDVPSGETENFQINRLLKN
ncbi:MAG: FxLYD domain-containing protein [Candidatus Thiodiazotropha sp.]